MIKMIVQRSTLALTELNTKYFYTHFLLIHFLYLLIFMTFPDLKITNIKFARLIILEIIFHKHH